MADGFLGLDPFVPPSWTVPETYLDGLSEDQKLEGITSIITVMALSDCDALMQGDVEDAQSILDAGKDDSEIAYKRIPVSLAATPNNNPVLTGISVDDFIPVVGARVTLDAGQTYSLAVHLSETSVETYTYRNKIGRAHV